MIDQAPTCRTDRSTTRSTAGHHAHSSNSGLQRAPCITAPPWVSTREQHLSCQCGGQGQRGAKQPIIMVGNDRRDSTLGTTRVNAANNQPTRAKNRTTDQLVQPRAWGTGSTGSAGVESNRANYKSGQRLSLTTQHPISGSFRLSPARSREQRESAWLSMIACSLSDHASIRLVVDPYPV